ncbi:pirin family protein [Zobellia galactanivorans]|uniref:pirin family protein n=1 Tax=Zobellia galactanivorans (strain DSM 12802 / CCUG 47099 / CIP 106680 / NCIMB 13871 / Dsij) TaxID=63186 RepID=UPI001C07ED6D|nr:pirin family protein [Zobellia galactanivorans]MBU3027441.1 pirin family protein [Zobellia galactanivorans]
MHTTIHKADTRGHANHGWLNSYHTFSFANYHDLERMNFGVLRVLNDDQVAAGMGFNTHTHKNMEIISIPLEGDLEHKDDMGNTTIIRQGDIQAMSAGTGIQHSEKNKSRDQQVKFLQIWVLPNKVNVSPRYDQISLKPDSLKNNLQQIVSPDADDDGICIHQNAWFHLGDFDKGQKTTYQLKDPANGVYIFLLEGKCTANGIALDKRDGLGIEEAERIDLSYLENSKILLMEVPMAN